MSPTKQEQKHILITGATGYIGGKLTRELLKDDRFKLRLMVRTPGNLPQEILRQVESTAANTLDPDSLTEALRGIDTAYYLIHSMGAGKNYADLDRESARNFLHACIEAGVRRIIYLGGLGVKETASPHLLSRIESGEILSSRPEAIQTLWFRAGIIIGSKSAGFQIIRSLVRKLPVMIAPRWISTKSQPIGINDVIRYLRQAAGPIEPGNIIIDIGTQAMRFQDMLKVTAKVMGLKRVVIPVPFFSPTLSSYWLILMTPVSFRIAGALVKGLKSETVKQNSNADKYFPQIQPQSYREAVRAALEEA